MGPNEPLVVQKYGGATVKNSERVKEAAERIVDTKGSGKNVVAVVSAPGNTTDRLTDMAKEVSDDPDKRELDRLLSTGEQKGISLVAMAVRDMGHEAVSFTGPQVGIYTNPYHTRAKIKRVDASPVLEKLKEGKIAIVAGFQGVSDQGDITTLGRGGSDLTAIAVASELEADLCEIYTDVEGIYTTDPSLASDARLIDKISYDELLEMASAGAEVMQPRSLEVAKKKGIKINIKSYFNDKEGGTMVVEEENLEEAVVRGVTLDESQIKVSIQDVDDRPGMAAKIFRSLGERGVNIDMIIQSSPHREGVNDISFTVDSKKMDVTKDVLESIKEEIGAADIQVDRNINKVSIVGIGMKDQSGVAGEMFKVLGEEGINIEMISTSKIKTSCAVSAEDGERALKKLHRTFCREE